MKEHILIQICLKWRKKLFAAKLKAEIWALLFSVYFDCIEK